MVVRQQRRVAVRDEVGVAGCDTEGLVRVSEQFAELELEMARQWELTAARVEAEKADWARVGQAMGKIYQTLCDGEHEGTMEALKEIETLLSKRGILVPQPVLPVVNEEAREHE
ncbi:MAG: hypothetical protein ACI4RT_08520 [Candidatus Spyradenecus sp.]